jgi:hypothetical protein
VLSRAREHYLDYQPMRVANAFMTLIFCSGIPGCFGVPSDRGKPLLTQMSDRHARFNVFISEHVPYMICNPKQYAANVKAARMRKQQQMLETKDQVDESEADR